MTLKVDGTNGVLQAYDYQVLTTGFSYTFAAGTQTLVINPAGTLATGTITMPASPVDGMTITITSTQEISTLTVNGNTGQSIVGTPGVLPANTAVQFVYRLTNTTWYSNTISPKGTLCRAWTQFTGSTGVKNGSFNVSSITRTAAGNYTANFTNAMPDTNYGITFGFQSDSGAPGTSLFSGSSAARCAFVSTINTGSVAFISGYLYSASTLADFQVISLAIHR